MGKKNRHLVVYPQGIGKAQSLPERKFSPADFVVGIDLGLLDFAVTSDGSKYQNPRHLKKHERNLKRKQKKLFRKQDKTNAKRRKAQIALGELHQNRTGNRGFSPQRNRAR